MCRIGLNGTFRFGVCWKKFKFRNISVEVVGYIFKKKESMQLFICSIEAKSISEVIQTATFIKLENWNVILKLIKQVFFF